MRVVVTGSTGVMGRRVCARLAEAGHEVVGVDRRSSVRPAPGVDLVTADLAVTDLRRLLTGVDTVVHLALMRRVQGGSVRGGVPSRPVLPGLLTDSPSGINDFFDEGSNIRMAYNVLRACFDAGVRRVVFASSNRVRICHTRDRSRFGSIGRDSGTLLNLHSIMRGDSATPGVETILEGCLVNPDFKNSSTSGGYSAAQIFICSTMS